MESPYEVLEVDPDDDDGAVVEAYRRRVKETHPDQGGSAREFQRVREAYRAITTDDGASGDGVGGPGGDGTAPDPPGRATTASGEAPDRDDGPRAATVRYLNYDVLDDHGWDLDDEDLFEKARDAGLDPVDCGEFEVDPDEKLLEAAEDEGYTWPYSCRGGACANCAVAVADGDLSTPVNHILPDEMTDRGIRLSCVGTPTTDELEVVFNVKHLPDLDELRLPPKQFERGARS